MLPLDERMDVKAEVEEDHLFLLFPRAMDAFAMSWQDATAVGNMLIEAAQDIKIKNIAQPVIDEFVQQDFCCDKIGDKSICLYFKWSDRIRLSYEAANVCGYTLLAHAQDLSLLARDIRISYKSKGRKNRPTPISLWQRSVFGKH